MSAYSAHTHGRRDAHLKDGVGALLDTGQARHDTHSNGAGVHPLAADHARHDAQARAVGGDLSSTDQGGHDTHMSFVGSGDGSGPDSHRKIDTQGEIAVGPDPDSLAALRIWATTYEGAARQVAATKQRLAAIGVNHRFIGGEEQLKLAEGVKRHARLNLLKAYRRTFPDIYAWAKGVVGLKTSSDLAWLLAIIGEPTIKQPSLRVDTAPDGHQCNRLCGDRTHLVALEPSPRTVGQLWAYCGHGAPTRRAKGMTAADALACGNTTAKMLAHRLAEAALKCNGYGGREPSPYRHVYDMARVRPLTEQRGDWTDLHLHNHAVRLTAKAILKDLWRVSANQPPQYGEVAS